MYVAIERFPFLELLETRRSISAGWSLPNICSGLDWVIKNTLANSLLSVERLIACNVVQSETCLYTTVVYNLLDTTAIRLALVLLQLLFPCTPERDFRWNRD
jgi:hypothetical protein